MTRIRVSNDGPMVVLDLGKAGKIRLKPGAARALASLLEGSAIRAEVVRGPVARGKIRNDRDAMQRFDDLLGRFAGLIKTGRYE